MTNCSLFLGATIVANGIFSGDAPLALLVFSAAFSNAFAGGLPALLRRSELFQQADTPEPGNRDLMGEGEQCGGVQEGSPEEHQGSTDT